MHIVRRGGARPHAVTLGALPAAAFREPPTFQRRGPSGAASPGSQVSSKCSVRVWSYCMLWKKSWRGARASATQSFPVGSGCRTACAWRDGIQRDQCTQTLRFWVVLGAYPLHTP